MEDWKSNEELDQTSNEWVEPELVAMAQADVVWEEMEWEKLDREEMGRKNVETVETHVRGGRAVLAARSDSANPTARR